ncbi:unnamed protein product [Meganyctiphanes norvegica]|uniref:Fibrinogen C-terminal domain-containing protein n=1 Tax=Meganyctiphanes norvegica TaxID=48144 RepID=A0AAV2RVS6_MEGNR
MGTTIYIHSQNTQILQLWCSVIRLRLVAVGPSLVEEIKIMSTQQVLREHLKNMPQDSVNYDFYIGNEVIHSLTDSRINELWVDIEDTDGETGYAHYQYFHVGTISTTIHDGRWVLRRDDRRRTGKSKWYGLLCLRSG